MKVIELLNKIANGEEVPKKICYCYRHFYFNENSNEYLCTDKDEEDTRNLLDCYCNGTSLMKWVFTANLNDEVEIIEEDKKIEKLDEILTTDDLECPITYNEMEIWKQVIKEHNKINEIIDYLEEKEQ